MSMPDTVGRVITYGEAIREALAEEMRRDSRVFILGEDVAEAGTPFKVLTGLVEEFGTDRVIDTPISEAGITGLSVGASMTGLRPVVDIMFGDFVTLVVDQVLQQASKIQGMYGKKIELPFILRTPMGGKRGYGPTHSQSLERLFFGIPHVQLLAINHRVRPDTVYQTLLVENTTATIILENKLDYSRQLTERRSVTHDYERTVDRFPTLCIRPKHAKPDVTVVCYGGTLHDCEAAAEELYLEQEVFVEVICPMLIQPLNVFPIIESLAQSHTLVMVEEGSNFAALGSEIIAQAVARSTPLTRVARIGNNVIIPACAPEELRLLPSKSKIKTEILNSLS